MKDFLSSVVLLRASAVSLGLFALGCGSTDDGSSSSETANATCTPNMPSACACPSGATGSQTCTPDGLGFGACACGSAGGPLPSDPGGLGGPSTSPTNVPDPNVPDPNVPDPNVPDPNVPDPFVADPNAPVVEVPGVACGSPLTAPSYTPPQVDLGGRAVYIDYACNKPTGTPVTFILNLHGTMSLEEGKIYQRGYLPAYNSTASHDFVIATPKAVGSQWGRSDGGRDEPHVMAAVDWVYQNFSGFDIRHMWVLGHSWGAMYTRTFACKPELADKVHGVVLMSGGAQMPACADRLAVIGTVGELDIVPGEFEQSAVASAHGCGARSTRNLGNNRVTEWPACGPGWVHADYFMIGKAHGFDPIDWPDEGMTQEIVDAIRDAR
jgi:pimeloyl-ACP methyl ester carboxylesterase